MKNYINLFKVISIALLFSKLSAAQTLGNGTKAHQPVPYKDFFTIDTTVYPYEMHIKVNPEQNLFTESEYQQLRERYPDYVLKLDTVKEVNHFVTKQHFMQVSSNETTGRFQLQYLLPLNVSGTVRISDANGKFIRSCYLPPNQKTKEIDIHDLLRGNYTLDLFFNNQQQDQVVMHLVQ